MSKRILGYYPATGEVNPFGAWFDEAYDLEDNPDMLHRISCLLLWGGSDIASSLYSEVVHPKNQNRTGMLSARDRREWNALGAAQFNGIPTIGVCRGAQMVCVGAGGYLFQHITGHEGRDHTVRCNDGDVFTTNSCHHQMMSLNSRFNSETIGLCLAHATDVSSVIEREFSGKPVAHYPQVEAAWYQEVLGLAIQWHPEWMSAACSATQKIGQWIEEFVVPHFPKSAPARIFNQRQPA